MTKISKKSIHGDNTLVIIAYGVLNWIGKVGYISYNNNSHAILK